MPDTVSSRDAFLDNYNKNIDPCLISKPCHDDVLSAICSPKNTCAGPDGISFAAWRAWPEASARVLTAVLDSICNGRPPPPGFNSSSKIRALSLIRDR